MMKILSLFLVFSCLFSGGVFWALSEKNHRAHLGGEDISIKGADKSFFVDYEKQAPPNAKTESPPSQSETRSPPSPPSNPEKPSLLEEKLALERRFASGVYDKTAKMVKEASSVLPKSGSYYNPKELICDAYRMCKAKVGQAMDKTKEGFHQVIEGGRVGNQKVKETGDLVVDKVEQGVGKGNDDEKELNLEERQTIADKTKEAWTSTKEELEKASEVVAEKVPTGEKAIQNIKKIGLDIQKIHNTLWDDRSAKTKITGLFNELRANFTYLSNQAISERIMEPTMGTFQLLALSNAYGIHVCVSFVSSNVLVGTLSKHQYARVESKISPIYFRVLVGSMGFSLLTHCLRSSHFGLHSFQFYLMLISLSLILFNKIYTKSQVTKIWFDKMNMEKGVGKLQGRKNVRDHTGEITSQLQNLGRQLKFMKALSSIVDVLVLIALTTEVACIGNSLSMV